MKILAAQFDRLAALIILVVMEGVFWPPEAYFSGAANQLPTNSFASTIFNTVLIAFLAAVYFLRRRQMRAIALYAWPILPLIAWAYLSAYWSPAPDIVLTRATKVAATALFGMYLIGRSDMPGFVALFVKANLIAAAASFAMMLFDPFLAISKNPDYTTAWRGAFTDKNDLGMVAALGEIFAIYALHKRYGSRWLSGLGVIVNLVLLHICDSMTSVMLLPICLYVGAFTSALRRRSARGLVAAFFMVLVALIGVVVLVGASDAVFAAIGRNATLSNRTRIWDLVIPYIARRPWLGYGLETFWLRHGVESNQVWAMLQWQAPHAHNIWFEMALSLGLVGVALAAFLWLSAFWRGVRLLFGPPSSDVPFTLALLVAIFVENLVEYSFFRGDQIAWTLFAAALVHLGRELALRRETRGTIATPVAFAEPSPFTAPAYRAAR